ncbi:MAG: signal peptide peptidase SppA [Deltaproteobacteria bacterium]|nr:signal peptide peptidase SppA [Deltaproteobacteria bacterium]
MTEKKGCIYSFFSSLWHLVDVASRVAITLVFLFFLLLIASAFMADSQTVVPASAALIVAPAGEIVEELSGDAWERSLAELRGPGLAETRLDELIEAIGTARDDGRIRLLVLDLDQMLGAGLSKLQELAAAVADFKESGKPVLARADLLDRSRYYLAATADEVYFHQSGVLLLTGFSNYQSFYKDALDRFEVDANVLRVGEFKSAVEPFLRNDMSEESRRASLGWMEDLWDSYVEDVSAFRSMEPAKLADFLDRFGDHLVAADGVSSRAAQDAGLVDLVGPRQVVEKRIAELLGEEPESESYSHIGWQDYLKATTDRRLEASEGPKVAVVVGRGTILDGDHSPGTIGGNSTSALIRQARLDEDVKAVVVRLDTGGGSVFASELIRQELERTREAGKTVVVSMSSVAASGGYWIATAADEVWASPTTITGSIGIFGLFPTVQKPLAKHLGVHVDGVGTTPLAGSLRMDREMQPELRQVLKTWLERGYADFLGHVAEARNMTVEEVDEIARGRVWSGEDAHELGLVDELGGLSGAVEAAASRAQLQPGYGVERVQEEPSLKDRLVMDLLSATVGRLGADSRRIDSLGAIESRSPLAALSRLLKQQGRLLLELNDPAGLYAHCLCKID